jgi:hypothetical protein
MIASTWAHGRLLGCEVRRDLREPREGAHQVHRALRIASLFARRALRIASLFARRARARGASRGELGRFLFRRFVFFLGLNRAPLAAPRWDPGNTTLKARMGENPFVVARVSV